MTLCNSSMNSDDPVQFVGELNQFYACFDVTDFSSGCDHVCDGLVGPPVAISEPEVTKCCLHVNPHKTPGPVWTCVFFFFFFFFGGGGGGQLLMNLHVVPRSWKTNTIIPVPKETEVRAVNDFRPVALTSVVVKCFKRLVHNELTSVALTSVVAKCFERLVCNQPTSVAVRLDPLQFAYRGGFLEDATLTLVNLIINHLDTTGSCVQSTFHGIFVCLHFYSTSCTTSTVLDLTVNDIQHSILVEKASERSTAACQLGSKSSFIV